MSLQPFKKFLVLAALALGASFAHAQHVTSLTGATVYAYDPIQYFGSGPQIIASGITWQADSENSVYGYTGGYGFAANGDWSGSGMSMIGTNNGEDSMWITFDNPVVGVGAFMNWARLNTDGDPDGDYPFISIYDADNNLLDTYELTFFTNGSDNSGEFHGFNTGAANIARLVFAGAYIGATDLHVVTSVPEPETYAMMLAGLALLGMSRRRKQ